MHLNNLLEIGEQLLRQTELLKEQNRAAQKTIEEQSIKIALQDIEIYNYTTQNQENQGENQE